MTAPATELESMLPALFLERLRSILSDSDYIAALDRMRGPGPCTFRINTLKIDVESAVERLQHDGVDPEPWHVMPEAWSVPAAQRQGLVYSPLAERGEIYIQNYSSMLPPLLLGVSPGQEVLDLTAAPGGKTLHLAALMGNSGRLAAVELSKGRFHRLRDNVRRGGADIVEFYCKDGARVGRQVPGRFDRVLLDAPCSSESRFDMGRPETWRYWSEKKIMDMQRKQKQLLYSAVLALKPGGRLVYSTCSFAPEENEIVIAHLLKKFAGELQVEEFSLPGIATMPGLRQWRGRELPAAVQSAQRVLPTPAMSGFFLCALRKAA